MGRLEGKSALITGAGSGLGRAMARRFAAEGARVLVTDVNDAAAAETVELIGGDSAPGERAAARHMDVTSEDDVAAAIADALARFGRLDILVANAGIGTPGFLANTSMQDWDRVLAVNLSGVFLCAKHAIPAMRAAGGGVILTTASVAGLQGTPHLGAYGASKAGVVQLTQTIALEGARFGIRANAICPVWTETPMISEFVAGTRAAPEQIRERLTASIPLGRMGTPDDVANAALFLASDEAAFITGIALPVDGGHMAGHGA